MTTQPLILIVDDDQPHRSMLRTVLRGWGYGVEEADDGTTAVALVRERAFDVVLTDVRMAHMDGITTLSQIRAWNPAIPVLIMTAWSSVESAVDALRLGAYDYLTKPLDFDVLRLSLERALDHTRLATENQELRRRLTNQESPILGRSRPVRELVEMVETVAPTEATVLITGESGTGKELVARAIQSASLRKDKPFVTINCAALAENLLESELFGHEKGAFTGADRRREGRFVQADKGTLFLDEIGEMPLSLQAKLLRVLQQGEVQRVGSDEPLTVDVRVIAATNRVLADEVAAGRFREDLFYRLNVIGLEVPPLRARQEDIPLLAAAFLERHAAANRKSLKGFTPQAMDAMLRYSWPGNVRELENAVERAVILTTTDYVTERALPLTVQNAPPAAEDDLSALGSMSLEDVEKKAIEATLRETEDNKSEAARRLGITRATLHSKLKKYGLES
ncbi:MAG TPA: sigma-54 dependent transcriptional regulator [Candidatus Mailhella merdigallinarum]|uniref:Sigma-54 dependent transcriptional regulator n=1 Tax=Candidatus Mailhella merdigallinarum TaxID=2838658 RepID=A0A9D2HE18_9BACT|nr:sigma-54 dependent transcriptional regulator [Candidatus Mailhella merdigallinarum]